MKLQNCIFTQQPYVFYRRIESKIRSGEKHFVKTFYVGQDQYPFSNIYNETPSISVQFFG